MKWSPGCKCCGCCPECLVFADNFGSSSLSHWTIESGDWSITTGGIVDGGDDKRLTVEGAGLLVANKENPHGIAQRVMVHVKGQVGQKIRVIINYADADNYLAAEVEFTESCGRLRLIERISAVEEILIGPLVQVQLVADAWIRVTICYIPKVETEDLPSMSNTGFVHVEAYPTTSTGSVDLPNESYHGIGGRAWRVGVGSLDGPSQAALHVIGAGVASFDNFFFSTTAIWPPASESPCIIHTPAWTDLTGWSEIGGSWAAASGELSTSDADAFLRDDVTVTRRVIVRTTVALGSNSDVARICVACQNPDNYYYLEASASGSNLRVRRGRRVAGVDTVVSTEVFGGGGFGGPPTVAATDPVSLEVWICDRNMEYVVNAFAARPYVDMGDEPRGAGVALATVATVAGVTYTGYESLHHRSSSHPLCPGYEEELECDSCRQCHSHGLYPLSLPVIAEADISGDPFTATPCVMEFFSGTWVHACSVVGFGFGCYPKGHGELLLHSGFPHLLTPSRDAQYLTVRFPVRQVQINTQLPKIRVKVDRLDADNYHYAEFDWTVTPAVVRVGRVVAGVDTVLDTGTRFDKIWATHHDEIAVQLRGDGAGGSYIVASSDLSGCAVQTGFYLGGFGDPAGPTSAESAYTPHNGTQVAIAISDGDITVEDVKVFTCCP